MKCSTLTSLASSTTCTTTAISPTRRPRSSSPRPKSSSPLRPCSVRRSCSPRPPKTPHSTGVTMSRRPAKAFRSKFRKALVIGIAFTVTFALSAGVARSEPAAQSLGSPPFTGSDTPIPAEPAPFDPAKSRLQAIYDADVAAGGTSYWFDRILARPFSDAIGEDSLMTRGRALFMYTHNPSALGFASAGANNNGDGGQGNGWAYRQPLAVTNPPTLRNLYTMSLSGDPLTEDTSQRVQYPSYFSATFTRSDLRVAEKKFITDNNVAVTDLTLTNTGSSPATTTVTATSPVATTPSADGTELAGVVAIRYGLTTIFPRFSGDGFTVSGTNLTRTVNLDPGASVSLKVQLGAIANEIPASATDYQRYRGYDPQTAWLAQMREYNKFWVDNVPYLDIPDKNVEKVSYYRLWENRFNMFDGNIPGNDYQYPADLEGAFGYNNQISLTVPMRLQDLQFYRDPLYSYGPWLSQGEESGCLAFHDQPGNTGNWNNTYEQWTAEQAWQSYLVHGGPKSVVANLAKYAECDVKGTLAKFDTNGNDLIQYTSGTLPGNDADSVAFKYYGTRSQDRTESSYWHSGAKAAAAEYRLLGNEAKAAEMDAIAQKIKDSILNNLWADGPVTNAPDTPSGQATGPRVPGKIGNAVKLNGSTEYVDLPDGIVSGLSDFTVSAWVNPAANQTWSRVFDFGTGTTFNMFMTVNAGGSGLRFAITTGGGGAEQQLTGGGLLPLNTWSHVAVTLSGTTGTLYLNGNPVATNSNMTLHPSSLGNTNQNWIGRSQYGDPLLNATVDDFAIYGHALSASEIGTLAGATPAAGDVADYKFDEAGGATALDSSGNGRTATIVSPGTAASANTPLWQPLPDGPVITIPTGSTNVPVTSTSGFAVGQKMAVGYGDKFEVATVTAVGRAGTQARLSAAASAGATNIKVTSTTNISVGDKIRLDIASPGHGIDNVTVTGVGTSGATGTGLTLAAPLRFDHSSNLPFSDRGTGISFTPATAFAHSSNEPVQALGGGITLDHPLAHGHAINAPVRDAVVTTAGYQGSPAPDQWFGGPALSAGSGNMVLRDAQGRVADSLNYGTLVDPGAAEGYQGGTGSGCTVAAPGSASGAGRSASRFPDGNDTDSNCADFITSSNPTPGGANLFSLDPGPLVSLQATTPGSTSDYIKHDDSDDGVITAPVTSGSSDTDKRDATWVEAAGLANPSCVSFESINKPGSYLRHQNFQFHLQPNDGSALFSQDATFCQMPGNSGQGVSFQSVNFTTRYIRAFENTVYLASNGGDNPWDTTTSFADDSSWVVATPWAHAP